MLSEQDNELLTRVGPGTPMGSLMRQFWPPTLLSSELPGPDCNPVRVLLLGEQLIAFRDSDHRVSFIDHYCPHRGASMFFGRNEECGLRCVYHGWKFDVDGNCVREHGACPRPNHGAPGHRRRHGHPGEAPPAGSGPGAGRPRHPAGRQQTPTSIVSDLAACSCRKARTGWLRPRSCARPSPTIPSWT